MLGKAFMHTIAAVFSSHESMFESVHQLANKMVTLLRLYHFPKTFLQWIFHNPSAETVLIKVHINYIGFFFLHSLPNLFNVNLFLLLFKKKTLQRKGETLHYKQSDFQLAL